MKKGRRKVIRELARFQNIILHNKKYCKRLQKDKIQEDKIQEGKIHEDEIQEGKIQED